MSTRIQAVATNGPRQRVCESALERVTITTLGTKKHTPDGYVRAVTVMLEFPGKEGKQPVRLTTDAATHLIACLTASLGAALNG